MGYTQKQVAALLGHSTLAHVSAYERGKRFPSLETALKLEVILCVPVAFLFEDWYRELRRGVLRGKADLHSTPHD